MSAPHDAGDDLQNNRIYDREEVHDNGALLPHGAQDCSEHQAEDDDAKGVCTGAILHLESSPTSANLLPACLLPTLLNSSTSSIYENDHLFHLSFFSKKLL